MWKRLPPALLLGFSVELVFGLVRGVHDLDNNSYDAIRSWRMFDYGVTCASAVLIASGLFEAAKQMPARAALGARLAGIAQVARLGFTVGFLVVSMVARRRDWNEVVSTDQWAMWATSVTSIAIAIGIGFASRRRWIVIALPIAAAMLTPVPPLGRTLWGWVKPSQNHEVVLFQLLPLVLVAAMLGAIIVACRDLSPAADERGDRHFARAARALWFRVIAALSLVGLTLLVAVAPATTDTRLLKCVIVAAPLVDAVALVMLGRALLGLSRANISRWLVLPAAAFALWTTGELCAQATASYAALFQEYGYWGIDPFDIAASYPTLVLLASATSIALVLVTITRLARRRQLAELTENATVRTGAFVVLVLGALFITRYGLERAMLSEASGLMVIGTVGAAAASIYALVIAAKLCAQAGAVLASDPAGLPAATLIKEGSR